MNLFEIIREEREAGMEKGRIEGIEITKKIFKMFQANKSLEEIAVKCNLTVEEVKEILN